MPKSKPKQAQAKSKKRLIVIILIICAFLAVFIGAALIWAYNNTSLFTRSISQAELDKNNMNPSGSALELTPREVDGKTLYAPKDMTVSVYATGIKSARFFAFTQNDTMFVGTKDSDSIYVVRDSNNDGTADIVKPIDSNLQSPHSVFYYNNDLYLGEENQVSVYRNITDDGTYEKKEVIVPNLPSGNRLTGGGHKTRTVAVGPDKKLYVSIGSSCNVCEEDDDRRATIMRYNLDGSGGEIYATGLRNTVGFDFDATGQLYGADMGRDQIGNDVPPEEINKISQGKNYGWPTCYGNRISNPEYPSETAFCQENTEGPVFEMQAHSAPLGFMFMKNSAASKWPEIFKSGYFVALHGSWNRTTPTGYKVIWVDTSTQPAKQYNFFTGWLGSDASASGRPVGLGFDSKGALYVSDDKQGIIYKITP